MVITALLDVRRVFAKILLFSVAAFVAAIVVSSPYPALARQLLFLSFSGLLLLIYYFGRGSQGETLTLHGGLAAIAIASLAWLTIAVVRTAVCFLADSNASKDILSSGFLQLAAPFRGDILHHATTMVAVLGGSIWEEVFFRGVLQGILLRRLPGKLAIAVVALLFAFSHSPAGFAHGAMFFAFSVLMSAMYRCFGLISCIILHALYNYPLALEAALLVGAEIRTDPFTTLPYSSDQITLYVSCLAAIPLLCTYMLVRCNMRRQSS